jgi:hypothetical protein
MYEAVLFFIIMVGKMLIRLIIMYGLLQLLKACSVSFCLFSFVVLLSKRNQYICVELVGSIFVGIVFKSTL